MRNPVKKFEEGVRVVRGPDWHYGDQDRNSIYGIMKHIEYVGEITFEWVCVEWIDYKGGVTNSNNYRVGEDVQDLYYYEE